jgi:pSer/pThr/pTyr-binding forkhead associated (FHA) protein
VPPAVVAAVVEDEATPFDALTEAASAPAPTATAPTAPAPAVPTAPAGGGLQAGKVKLVVEQGQTVGAQFVLGDPEMLVGREDEEEDIYPDIDLSDQDAGYVHRKHATLRFENGGLTVTHLGGANKTRINNKPVPDNVPTPVNLGDKLAFGKVVLRLLPV